MTQTVNTEMRFSMKKRSIDNPKLIDTWGTYNSLKNNAPKIIDDAMVWAEKNKLEFFKITLLVDLEEWTVANF